MDRRKGIGKAFLVLLDTSFHAFVSTCGMHNELCYFLFSLFELKTNEIVPAILNKRRLPAVVLVLENHCLYGIASGRFIYSGAQGAAWAFRLQRHVGRRAPATR